MTEVFRNRTVLVLWGFFFWFALGSTAMTCVILRDGPPDGFSSLAAWLVCAAFWLTTVGLAFLAAHRPLVFATVGSDRRLTVVARHGWKKERRVFPASSVRGAKLVVLEDSDGAPYYRVRVMADGRFEVDVCEGHSRETCEEACERFNAAYRSRRGAVDAGARAR